MTKMRQWPKRSPGSADRAVLTEQITSNAACRHRAASPIQWEKSNLEPGQTSCDDDKPAINASPCAAALGFASRAATDELERKLR